MKNYVDSAGLQEYTDKLIPKLKTIFPGAPLVAATVAAMTDHAKVYVYTGSETGYTAGNWYYWDGTAWASGGVYNSTALTTDKTLSVSDMAADAKVTGDDITDLKNAMDEINGDQFYTFTQFETAQTPASGVTAELVNGKLKLYGTAGQNRRWLCLNGQNISATTSTAFTQTLPAGVYRFDIKVTGTQTADNVLLQYTETTFAGVIHYMQDGETIKLDAPVMVGLFIKNTVNYGTSESPTYVDAKIYYYSEKTNMTDFNAFKEIPENLYFRGVLKESDDLNDLTNSGWYYNTSSHVPAHAPLSGPFKYLHFYYNGTAFQIAMLNTLNPEIIYRCKTSLAWGDWEWIPKTEKRVLPTYADVTALFTGGVLTAGTYTLKGYTSENSPIMLKMQAMYTTSGGSNIPYLQFESRKADDGRLYFSHKYEIESDKEFKMQEWRIPNNFTTDYVNIIITVPEGSTLAVKSFACKYVPYVSFNDPQIIFHAHRGLEKFWPAETFNSVVAAAEMGFKSCIVIPKFTSDGVAVCFHNDGGENSPLNAYLTEPDGSAVPELVDTSVTIGDFTYDELMQWSMGYVKNSVYADEKILKMDDFLRVCAETGMRPIFSIHPTLSADQWSALKVLLDKYNLSGKLSVKDGDTITWTRVINAFGDGGVYSIISLSSTAIDQVSKINTWKTTAGVTKTRVDAEWMNFDPTDATYLARTQEAKAAGLVVSAVLHQNDTGNY